MIRFLAFTAALWGTARLAVLPHVALRITRRIAPPDMRHVVDRAATDAELIEVCAAATRLSAEIEAARDTRANTTRTIEEGEAFDHRTIRPLIQRRRFLGERSTMLQAGTLAGHRARARMVLAWRGGVPEADEIGHEVEPAVWALARDLAEVPA